tara:strand:- start:9817 stop:10794 length:978 start_codon:yes stop_codon:yes gene_type:complete
MKNNNNNIIASVNHSINNINNNVKKVAKNDLIVNTIRVLLVIYASFVIPELNANQLNYVNNTIVRLVVVSLIVYLSFIDMVTAMLLLISFVVTIHTNKNNTHKDNEVNENEKNFINKINNLTKAQIENYENEINENVSGNNVSGNNLKTGNNVSGNNANKFNLNMQGIPPTYDDSSEILGGSFDVVPRGFNNETVTNAVFNSNNNKEKVNNINIVDVNEAINRNNKEQPASETMTESLMRAKGFKDDPNSPKGLTTAQHLYDVSENAVPGADVNDQVKTFEKQLGIQGMDEITGPNARRYDGYHYNNEAERPNLTSEMILDRKSA